MSREEFMKRLEELLYDIPKEERNEALEYYRGYFEDAGIENEADIIRELESPEKVAQTIKAEFVDTNKGNTVDLNKKSESAGTVNLNKAQEGQNTASVDLNKADDSSTNSTGWSRNDSAKAGEDWNNGQTGESGRAGGLGKLFENLSTWQIVLIVFGIIAVLPVLGTMFGGVFGVFAGIIGVLFGILGCLIGIAFGCLGGGVASLTGAVGAFIAGTPGIGFLLLGVTLLLWAISILGFMGLINFCVVFIPWFIRNVKVLIVKLVASIKDILNGSKERI